MVSRTERTERIEKLENEFGDATGIYLTDVNRIDAGKITDLRAEFRKNGLRYIVVKNTLARIALERKGIKEITPFLKGQVGVVIAKDDPTVPAKLIKDFRKKNKDLLEVKAAYVEGTTFDAKDTERLADIPSKEVLLSQLLSCMQAPITKFAQTLNGFMTTFVGTLDAVKTKKESEQ